MQLTPIIGVHTIRENLVAIRLQIGDKQGLCALNWRQAGSSRAVSCVWGVQDNGIDGNPNDAMNTATRFANAWTGAFETGTLSNGFRLETCDAAIFPEGNDGDAAPQQYTLPIGQIGTMADGHLPVNCAAIIKKKCVEAGKGRVGRAYVPSGYVPEAQVSESGVLDAGLLANLQSFATQFLENLGEDDIVPMVFHALNSHHPGPASQVTSLILDSLIGTQRRRLRK
jgi:hypothetical protein